jgi:hypothetical protein
MLPNFDHDVPSQDKVEFRDTVYIPGRARAMNLAAETSTARNFAQNCHKKLGGVNLFR